MKRDMDLIRELLLKLESMPARRGDVFTIPPDAAGGRTIFGALVQRPLITRRDVTLASMLRAFRVGSCAQEMARRLGAARNSFASVSVVRDKKHERQRQDVSRADRH
jgi:hypothetical protein